MGRDSLRVQHVRACVIKDVHVAQLDPELKDGSLEKFAAQQPASLKYSGGRVTKIRCKAGNADCL